MVKLPRIVVTDIDEDPAVRRMLKIKEIKDWSALLVIVMLLWLMAATRMCFLLGAVMASITSIIATAQFFVLIKSRYSRHIGNYKYKVGPHYQMPFSLYLRSVRESVLCNTNNKIANKPKHQKDDKDKDKDDDGIPKMHSPL